MVRVKELTDIDRAAEAFDYSRRIELEMENFEKISSINKQNRLVKNILIKEISGIENNIETLKLEFCRISSQLSDLFKEKDYLEHELNKLNIKYEMITSESNEIKNNLTEKHEEFKNHSKANDYMKREVEDLELAIALEENTITEKKKELKNLEITSMKNIAERRRLDKLASQAILELKRKVKVREIIEERINDAQYAIPIKIQYFGKESEDPRNEEKKNNKMSKNGQVKLYNSIQNIKIKRIQT